MLSGNKWFFIFLIVFVMPFGSAQAEFNLECYRKDNCNGNWRSSSSNPSAGSQLRINPAFVPTELGYGIEGIYYKNEIDLSLVRGSGRIGAAISPSNSDETFFGPPGFEDPADYLERKTESEKFPNQKYSLAMAMNVANKNGTGLSNYSLKLGGILKYNKLTTKVDGGVGINGTLNLLSLGASIYEDETQLEDSLLPISSNKYKIRYQVQTYNIGLFFNSLIVDYSNLKLKRADNNESYKVSVVTASLLVKDFIYTLAKRTEDSSRPYYNYDTKQFETQRVKDDYFGGVQYRLNKNLMMGVFLNYYLLHELSLSATVFF